MRLKNVNLTPTSTMIRVPSAFSVSGPGGNLEPFRQPLAKIPIEVGDFPIIKYKMFTVYR